MATRLGETTPELVYERTVDRVKDIVPDANPATCFLSLNPHVTPPTPGQFFYVITPPPFQVDQGCFEGGGNEQLQIRQIFTVTICSAVQLDHPQQDTQFLIHGALGVIKRWSHVLKALSNHELADTDGNWILAEPIRPTEGVAYKDDRTLGAMQLGFEICYDIDLSNVLV